MNYNLAKKLKDSGFKSLKMSLCKHGMILCEPIIWDKSERPDLTEICSLEEYVSFPTLSELIEACVAFGRPIELVSNVDMRSSAKVVSRPEHYNGSTPEEAVANLWLKLHETH